MCLPRTEHHITLMTASPISGLPDLPVIPEGQRTAVSKDIAGHVLKSALIVGIGRCRTWESRLHLVYSDGEL